MKTCFFIAPIGDDGSEIRHRSDLLLEYLLKPALHKRYDIVRADSIAEPGAITTQIIKIIADADWAVADLTGLNPNVVYELGIRHSLNKPAIQIMDQGQRLPFDLAGERTIFFKHDDIRSFERAKRLLIEATQMIEEEDFINSSPVSRAIDISNLLESSSGVGRQIAIVIQELLVLSKKVDDISSDQSTIEITVDGIASDISELNESIETWTPQRVPGKGLYIDDKHLIRLLEDIELHLRRLTK